VLFIPFMSDGVQRFIADVLSACVVDLAACSSVVCMVCGDDKRC
jgi:hypothetical protein